MTIPATSENVGKAVAALQNGGVIAMPTDTLYALVADARDAEAVRRVYAIKGREDGKPLPLFVADTAMAERFGEISTSARKLTRRFWPGALTVVVNKAAAFDSEALAGGATVALRVPDHDLARAIVAALGGPITATSANRSGGPDPASADEVRRQLGNEVDIIIDGGVCPVGVSSTIVDCTGAEPRILRHGAITEASIMAALSG